MISFENISVSIQGKKILDSLDLSISEGEVVLITGDNGSGKTTLFEVLTGQISADAGIMRIDQVKDYNLEGGQYSVSWERIHNRTKAGILTCAQSAPLYDTLTLAEHTRLLGTSYAAFSEQIKDQVSVGSRLKTFELEHAKDHRRPINMSFGERRAFSVARQLALSPLLCLLDEPFAGLDRANSDLLASRIERAKADRSSIVIIEHESNAAKVASLVDRVFELKGGRLHATTLDLIPESQVRTGGQPGLEIVSSSSASKMTFEARFSSGNTATSLPPLLRDQLGRNVVVDGSALVTVRAPNGWGKSTLCSSISGLENPFGFTSEISINSKSCSERKFQARRKIGLGMLRTTPRFPPRTKVETLFRLAKSTPDARSRGFYGRDFETLSGGERKYVLLDAVLSQSDINVCLLDEPYVGLDANNRNICAGKVQKFVSDKVAILFEPA